MKHKAQNRHRSWPTLDIQVLACDHCGKTPSIQEGHDDEGESTGFYISCCYIDFWFFWTGYDFEIARGVFNSWVRCAAAWNRRTRCHKALPIVLPVVLQDMHTT